MNREFYKNYLRKYHKDDVFISDNYSVVKEDDNLKIIWIIRKKGKDIIYWEDIKLENISIDNFKNKLVELFIIGEYYAKDTNEFVLNIYLSEYIKNTRLLLRLKLMESLIELVSYEKSISEKIRLLHYNYTYYIFHHNY